MKVEQLLTYPIKSLRAHQLSEAQLTQHGFPYDRRFMLLQVKHSDDGLTAYKNMHVSHYNELVLFFPTLHAPSSQGAADGRITVTYKPPAGSVSTMEVPLEPSVASLTEIEVSMHKSETVAYKMDEHINKWFSQCLGYEVILAYLGPHHRAVLMSTSSREENESLPSWWTTVSDVATSVMGKRSGKPEKEITFADCAPYLVASERSMDDVHRRLPDGQHFDISKFRPNIIVSGADEPWEEDYWAELTINNHTRIACVQNCGRCVSINVDYATGKPATTEAGKMLAKLSKDRRVDPGMKYSPIFGRYSFLDKDCDGHVIKVGDQVQATRTNQERTRFDWQGLCT